MFDLYKTQIIASPMDTPFFVTELAVEKAEDWSGCRSIPRAKRREKRGFPQRVKRETKPACYKSGREMLIHPALFRKLKESMSKAIDRRIESELLGAYQSKVL